MVTISSPGDSSTKNLSWVCDRVLMALKGRCGVTPDGATTSSYPRILGAEEASACWLSSQEDIVPQVLYPCRILSQGRVGILERSNAFIMGQLLHGHYAI